jgi:DNA-binding transcriptional ArsR family regulator
MEPQFKDLDVLLHARLRLAVMSLLVGLQQADFSFLREKTGATAGNLSAQLSKLEEAGYVKIVKSFRNNYPCTTVSVTQKGIWAFERYAENLKSYLNMNNR